ncbi:MAG: diheme cytochrome c [Azonexus sp.]|jgi:hypothetical protein|nr:diheme cytochrome c [Azonexus sp.]
MKTKYHPLRPVIFAGLTLAASALLWTQAIADGKHFFPPVADAKVKEECGSCHMAFSPAMLPARSWQKMMGDLGNHFGDDASLAPQLNAEITDYLVRNAADANNGRYGSKLMRGLSATSAPLRITELPKWQREHREVPAWEWRHKEVRTKANCLACHVDAERGYYDDD